MVWVYGDGFCGVDDGVERGEVGVADGGHGGGRGVEAAVLQATLEGGVALLHLAPHRLQQHVLLKQFLGKGRKC